MPAISAILLTFLLAQAGAEAFRAGRYEEAHRELQREVQMNPGNRTATAFLAMTDAAQGHCSGAQSEFAANPDAELARLAGLAAVECLAATNQQGAALTLLGTLQARFSGDADVLYEAAKLHRKAWNQSIQTLFEKAPASYRVNQISAEVFESEGKFREAAAQYRVAIGKAPQTLDLHYRLGRCLLLESSSGEHLPAARTEFEAELRLNPSDAVAIYQVGQILAAQGKPEEALKQYEEALKAKPEFTEALIAAGRVRASLKDASGAAHLFERAVALQPENESAHYNLMIAYRNLGRLADAENQKRELDRLQKPKGGEFSQFLKTLGEPAPNKP